MKRVWGFIVLLLLWQAAAQSAHQPAFPGAWQVLVALVGQVRMPEFWANIASSLWLVVCGFGSASVLGVLMGIALSHSRWVRLILQPVVDFVRPVSAVTIFPLFIILLGIGVVSKSAVIAWAVWPAVLLNTAHGFERVAALQQDCIEAARLDGANERQVLRYVSLPLAVPAIFTGLRIGISGGWIALISAEMLGASRGLGYAVNLYSNAFKFADLYATIVSIALLGLGMNAVLFGLQHLFSKEGTYESLFTRFGTRASAYVLDSLWVGPAGQVHRREKPAGRTVR